MTIMAARASVLSRWLADGRSVVAGLLVQADGSSPMEPGAMMLIDHEGNVEGTVTGGCVEAAVIAESEDLLATPDRAVRLVRYGVTDDAAGAVGLTCGGTVHILIHQISGDQAESELAYARAVLDGEPAVIATLLDSDRAGAEIALVGDTVTGTMDAGTMLDRAVIRDSAGILDAGHSTIRTYGSDGSTLGADLRVFYRVHARSPMMLLIGAIDFAAALAPMATALGYAVTVCDARETFIRSPRFARVADVVREWPDRLVDRTCLGPRDAVLILTHDPKFDERALRAAVHSGAGYIGALGSRRTVADRTRRLREAGLTDEQLDRIISPCGLDLGAHTPEETAISILAEIIARRTGRGGGRLHALDGDIHNHDGGAARTFG